MSCSVRQSEAMSDSRKNDEKPISRLQCDLSGSSGIRCESPKKTLYENLSKLSHKYGLNSEIVFLTTLVHTSSEAYQSSDFQQIVKTLNVMFAYQIYGRVQ